MAIIRHANKFLQRDLTKFMDPGYPKNDRLFKFVSDMSEITAELIQNSCDAYTQKVQKEFGYHKPSQDSLKINDYKNNKAVQTIK